LFGLLVVTFLFGATLQAQVKIRGIDRADEVKVRLDKMRAVLNAEGHTFEIDANPATNYTLDQLCNLNPKLAGPEDLEREALEQDIDYVMALPSAYTGYCGTVRNQGSCGSCWAFGIIGQIEAQWRKVVGSYYNFSEQYLLDCNSYGYSCNGGWFTAFNDCKYPKYFKWESCYPYVGYKKSCTASSSCNADYISSWYYVGTSYSVPSVSAIKQKIYDEGAVAAAVYVDYYFQYYSSGCFSRNSNGSVNHAIVLCGWDDSRCSGYGAWKLKNSWGTGWGENGYMWIKYGCQRVGYAACYANY